MQTQFEVFIDSLGNVSMSRGMVLDLTGPQPNYFPVGASSSDDPLNAEYRLSSNSTTEFSGGSGENILISGSLSNPSIDVFGNYRKTSLSSWSKKNNFSIEFNESLLIHEISDGVGVIATFPGLEMQRETIRCSSFGYNGGQGNFTFKVFLGIDQGDVSFYYDAYSVPDIFIVSYDGVDVINTGLVGKPGVYDGVQVNTVGPESGIVSFTKGSANPQVAYVTVIAPYTGTAWEFNLGCPNGSAASNPPKPPGVPTDSDKLLFAATSTTFGEQNNNNTPFTLDVIYENKQSLSEFDNSLAIESGVPLSAVINTFAGVYNPTGYSLWQKENLLINTPVSVYVETGYPFNVNGFPPDLFLDSTTGRDFSDGSYFLNYVGSELYEYSLSDSTDIVSYMPANQSLSPVGYYLATAYGALTYGDGASPGILFNNVEFQATPLFLNLYSKTDGSGELHDGTDVVASASQVDQLVPSGVYLATQYGKDTYNSGVDFELNFSGRVRNTAYGWFYIQVNFTGTTVTSVSGPFFKNNMPDNTPTLKNIPIAFSDGYGTVDQIHEGTLIFK